MGAFQYGFHFGRSREFGIGAIPSEQSLALYDPAQDYLSYYVQDPGVTGSTRLARLLFDLVYPEAALRKGREAVSLGRKLLILIAVLCLVLPWRSPLKCGEYLLAEQIEEEAIALANQHGLIFLATLATIWRGWALIGQGLGQEGLEC